MSKWLKVKMPEDPAWIEYKAVFMSPTYGRCRAAVWQRGDGCFWCSVTEMSSGRHVFELKSEDIESAKAEAMRIIGRI